MIAVAVVDVLLQRDGVHRRAKPRVSHGQFVRKASRRRPALGDTTDDDEHYVSDIALLDSPKLKPRTSVVTDEATSRFAPT